MRGGKLVRVAFLAIIALAVAKLVQALRGTKAPQFTNHPSVDGGPTATPDAPLVTSEPAPTEAAPQDTEPAAMAELASPAGPDGVLDDPRRELAGELPTGERPPELAAPPTPEALSAGAVGADGDAVSWRDPVGGACPEGYPIKAKLRSGIYHQPGGVAYERTKPDRCYATASDAEADGLRPPKR